MYLGEYVHAIFRIIGSMFCHQLQERSLCLNGIFMPVCARDAGIYSSIFISMFFVVIMRKLRADKPPALSKTFVLCIMMIPMMLDGFTSYAGLRDTNNSIRFITGICFGMPIPLFLIPTANYSVDYENKNPIIKSWHEVFGLILINAIFCCVVLKTNFISWYVLSTMVIGGFLLTIGRLVFTVVTRICGKKPKLFLTLGITTGVLICMFMISKLLIKIKDILI